MDTLVFSRTFYIGSVLRRSGLSNSKPAMTPMVECLFSGLSAETDKTLQDEERHQQMIGCLLYLALYTRLDIVSPALILARFQNLPTAYFHSAVKRILRYLRGTSEYGLTYKRRKMNFEAYVDADYAPDTMDRRSMSAYVVQLGNAICICGSKKQRSVALSTSESE